MIKQQTAFETLVKHMRPTYYDMDTNPIDLMQWGEDFETLRAEDKHIIAKDIIGKYLIVTSYIGLDMGLMYHLPLIFETMIFCEDKEDGLDLLTFQYTWKQEALEGHKEAVSMVQKKIGS